MKTTQHNARIYALIVFILFLSTLPFVFGDTIEEENIGTIATSKPTIGIYFGEKPVTIDEYSLLYQDTGAEVTGFTFEDPVPNDVTEPRFYNFTAEDYMVNGLGYTFYVRAHDTDNNYKEIYTNFTIKTSQQSFYFIQPEHPYIEDSTFAMAQSNIATITITTEKRPASECRYGFPHIDSTGPALNAGAQAVFYVAQGRFEQSDDKGLEFTTTNFDFSDYNLDEGKLYQFVIVCQEPGETYSLAINYLGYDTSAPSLDLLLTPTEITDYARRNATLSVETGDMTICSYQNTAYPEGYYYNIFTQPDYNSLIVSDYDYQTTERLLFTGVDDSPQINQDTPGYPNDISYTINVTCENIAGLSTSKEISLPFDFAQEMDITIEEPGNYASSSSVAFSFTTNVIPTYCTLTIDDVEHTVDELTISENGREFTYTETGVNNSVHYYSVFCQQGSLFSTVTDSFSLDTENPYNLTITTDSVVCGDVELDFDFDAEDDLSGVDYYNYTLTVAGEKYVDGEISNSGNEDYILSEPESSQTISISMFAVDNAGNKASAVSKTITHKPEGAQGCDQVPPTTSSTMTLNTEKTAYDVLVSCSDDSGSCSPTFKYSLLETTETCEDAPYANTQTLGETISVTEDQLICWEVTDIAGNPATGSTLVSLSLPISLINPEFGIGPTQTYDLEIATERAADCTLGFYISTHPTDECDWVAQLPNTFSTTGGVTHTYTDFNLIDVGATVCTGQDECEEDIVIGCVETDGRCHTKTFTIGYDTTEPELEELYFSPNPLITPGSLQTTLYMSADDMVWCRYTDDNGESDALQTGYGSGNADNYYTSYERYMGYYAPPILPEISYVSDYEIMCVNLAGLSTTETKTLTVAPVNQVDITVNTENIIDTGSVPLDVTTNHPSTCYYQLDASHPYTTFGSTGATDHTTSVSLAEGEHNIIITCNAVNGPYQGAVTFSVMVDPTKPVMNEVVTTPKTCDLSSISFRLASDAEVVGLDYYVYWITANGEQVTPEEQRSASGSVTIKETLDLTTGTTYTIHAYAVDELGRLSTEITNTTLAQNEDTTYCDDLSPTASITAEELYDRIQITVTCDDSGTGCASTFDYYFTTDITEDCADVNYTTTKYTQTIAEDSSGKVCARVFDLAGNNDTVSEVISIVPYCSNGVEDPEEDGVDCGGLCPSQCDLCSNGRKDSGETGVDCGGTCSASCDYCGNNYVGSNEECDGSTLLTCQDLGFSSGTLYCDTDTCLFETGACEDDVPEENVACGNGVVETGESCDGLNWGGIATCEDISSDFIGGTPTCNPGTCHFDTSDCYGEDNVEFCTTNYDCDSGYACNDGICEIDSTDNTDSDGDGLPDWWEEEYFDCTDCADPTEDPDNDTYTNIQEYKSLTDPTDAGDIPTSTGSSTDSDGDGLPDWWEEEYFDCTDCAEANGDPDGDGFPNLDEYYASSDPTDKKDTPATGTKKGINMLLLIIGLVLFLGGGGYITYSTLTDPPIMKEQPMPTGQQNYQQQLDPAELERRKKEMLAAMERKRLLQQQAKAKAQAEKNKERKSLLSSFKNDELATPVSEKKETPKEKTVIKPTVQAEKKEPVKKETSKKQVVSQPTTKKTVKKTSKDTDALEQLSNLQKKEKPIGMQGKPVGKPISELAEKPTQEDIFEHLAKLSGHTKNKIKTAINKPQISSKELAELFSNAEKKHITPQVMTPAFKHLIQKGKLDHKTVHQAVHHLHKNDKLTSYQKEKILNDLKAIQSKK